MSAARIWRSLLFVPANNLKMLNKATSEMQDAVLIDLEDACPPAEKETGRIFARDIVPAFKAKGIDKWVKAEFIAKEFPDNAEWAVFAGLEEVAELLKGMKVNVRAMEEGTIFRPLQPVMEIEGMYTGFGVYETALLGLICQASGIATRAARCKMAAGERTVISFGARRMHPVLAPMIERNAYIGGCDGVSVISS